MRAPAAIATTALALTALTACSDSANGDIDCADNPTVTVDDAGSGPKTALTLAPKAGDTVDLNMEMDMTMSIVADGSSLPTGPIPTITMGMATKVERVSDDEIEMSFEYDRVDAGGDAAVESTLKTMVGTSGTITTDANGVYLDGSIEPAPGMNSAMESTLQQLEQQFANLTVPLPDEPVGEGAAWEVETPIELNGLQTCNTYTYTLDELDGSTYTIDVDLDQQMIPGTVDQNGVEAELVEGSSSGSGTMSGDLEMPLAISGTTTLDSSTTMKVNSEEMETEVGLDLTVSERK